MMTREQHMDHLRGRVARSTDETEFFGVGQTTLGVLGNMGSTIRDNTYGDFGRIRILLSAMARAGMLGPLGGSLRVGMGVMGVSTAASPEMAEAMEEMFQKILKETRKALRQNEHIVRALVALLIEKEELLADDVKAFFDQYGLFTPEPSMIRDGETVSIFNPQLPDGEPEPEAGD